VKWTGTLTPPKTGTYTFGLTSDDGSRLFINGQQVIDNWRDQAANTETAQVDLSAGTPVQIEVDYYQAGGDETVNLGWVEPGDDLISQAADLAAKSDVAIVYANDFESEGSDLDNIDLPGDQNQLIDAVANANPNTVVVLNTGSAVTMPWLDKVKSVFEAWYPGQESGHAIAALLYGDANPSGKLPVTFPRSLDQVPASTPAQWTGVDGKVQYSEGLEVGYRWYDSQNMSPLYPFGYGLSYTTFRFSNLHLSEPTMSENGRVIASANVTNTGSRTGADVAQLYLTDPAPTGEPPLQLKGFSKVSLRPGQTKKVQFAVTAQDASYWHTLAHDWILAPGTYTVHIGDSSRSLPLSGTFRVTRATGPQYTTVSAPDVAVPGTNVTVTTKFANDATVPVRGATASLSVPAGWTAQPQGSTHFGVVAPGDSRTVTWTVGVPSDASGGPATLAASTAYSGPRSPATGTTTVQVAYSDLASAFDTVGVSDDSNPAPGNLDGSGYSYSAQALASVGVTPGDPVGSTGFSWPDVPAGQADAVTAKGQIIALNGSGSSLSFLGTGTNGAQSGPVTVTYQDGTTSTGTITFADWYSNAAVPGCTLVVTTPHWNEPAGSTLDPNHQVSLYAASLPLTAGKQIAYITLPSNARLHVFATSLG
jgi:beta-glucosidase